MTVSAARTRQGGGEGRVCPCRDSFGYLPLGSRPGKHSDFQVRPRVIARRAGGPGSAGGTAALHGKSPGKGVRGEHQGNSSHDGPGRDPQGERARVPLPAPGRRYQKQATVVASGAEAQAPVAGDRQGDRAGKQDGANRGRPARGDAPRGPAGPTPPDGVRCGHPGAQGRGRGSASQQAARPPGAGKPRRASSQVPAAEQPGASAKAGARPGQRPGRRDRLLTHENRPVEGPGPPT